MELEVIGELLLQLQEALDAAIAQGGVGAGLLIHQQGGGVAVAGSATGNVVLLDQGHREALLHQVIHAAGADDAAADHGHIIGFRRISRQSRHLPEFRT